MANPKDTSKWDKATARVTGEGAQPESNAPGVPASVMISKADDATIAEMLKDPSMEFAPQVHKLSEGDMITGILEGNGPDAELENLDRVTKEVRTSIVKTWIIASADGGQRVSILSTAQLERKLPPFVGGLVKIVRGKDINTNNGQRVTDYLVGGPKREDGTRRSWAMKPVLDVPATEKQNALPAGNQVAEHTISQATPAQAS
jgi:hypothetical protein